MAHEIKNFLQPLRANLATLKECWQRHPPAEGAELIPEILEEMRLCLDRITCILQAARSAPGDAQKKQACRLENILQEAARIVHAQTADIVIRMKFPRHLPEVQANAQELLQVFVNLLQNAAAATRCVKKPEILITATARGAWLKIAVRDNGEGLAPHIVKKLFTPFVTTRRAEGGTGLGLHISRKIVQNCGGDIGAKNHPKGGAVFTVRLPI